MSNTKKRVLLGVTGSIAAYKSAEIIRRLLEEKCSVAVVMTKEAEEFVTPLTLGSLAGEKVYRDWFVERESLWQMPHIKLAREADCLLIAPATAHFIGKLASGLADDLLSCTILVAQSPIYIAPAMNTNMFENKIVQENCQKLKKAGMHFINPVKGQLACGMTGDGHLAEVEEIVRIVCKK